MAESADAADLKSAGAILVGSSPSPGTRWDMAWLIIAFGYLLGSIPTAYLAGRFLRGTDIREMGDGNMGAQNAFRQLGPWVGIAVGLIDAGKGALAVSIANGAQLPQLAVFVTGGAAVVGHNFPLLLGFRGGRGEATTIGIFLTLMTIPFLIAAIPALVVLIWSKNVTLSSAVLFILLILLCWWRGVSGALITYSLVLLLIVTFTHVLTSRRVAPRQA